MLSLIFHVALLVICCKWIATVVRRFRSDLAEVRGSAEPSAKQAIIAIWALTVLAILWVGQTVVSPLLG